MVRLCTGVRGVFSRPFRTGAPAISADPGARAGRGWFRARLFCLVGWVTTWLIVAAERTPFVPVWNWMPRQNHLVLAIMLPVCLIVALSIGRPNPFSFGGARNAAFDPARPGIVWLAGHPFLVALALWSGAHLVANGDLAHILLFGTFFGFALFGRRLVDRRKRREMGQSWDLLWERVLARPLGEELFQFSRETVLRAALGVGLYLALIMLHPIVIGVDPIP